MRLRYQGMDWYSENEVRQFRFVSFMLGAICGAIFVALGVVLR